MKILERIFGTRITDENNVEAAGRVGSEVKKIPGVTSVFVSGYEFMQPRGKGYIFVTVDASRHDVREMKKQINAKVREINPQIDVFEVKAEVRSRYV